MLKVYYGLTNYSQLKRMQRDLPIMVSGRWLIKLPSTSIAFQYMSEYTSVFLDSGAFGAAKYDGGFTYTPDEYLELVHYTRPELWASMDYPCEPSVRNGQTIEERLRLTVDNAAILAKSGIPGFIPVIQGWEPSDYLACIDMMEAAGLVRTVMGIGTLCRRGSQQQIVNIVRHLSSRLPATKFHAFGVKISTLKCNHGEALNYLESIDTAAWQFNEKDELGGWRPRTHQELVRRLEGYKKKLNRRVEGPYQLVY